MRLLLTTALVTCLPALALAVEDGHTELGAHEHGAGVFNVAIEGRTVSMELESPGADIVGFEHAAKSDKDKAAIEAAKATLKDLAKVVALPAAAGCKLAAAKVELHSEGGDHDDHDHGKKAEKHDGHDRGKHAEEEGGHTEFHAEYQLNCSKPESLTGFSFAYFDTFQNARELEVSIAGPSGQKRLEATRDNNRVDLGGIM